MLMPLTSGFPFFRDEVQARLVSEVQELRDNVTALQEMLSEVSSI
jgi:archaellum component FlaC